MVLGKFPLENAIPENSYPSNYHPLVNPTRKIPTKFPPGIFGPISLIRRYYKRLYFSLKPSLCLQTGEGGSVEPFPPGR